MLFPRQRVMGFVFLDFREGLLQLLDFAHSLPIVGEKPFKEIFKASPFGKSDKALRFKFPRKFG